jgi:hypothetical protein
MDIFSNSVLVDITNRFPEFQNKHNQTSKFLELDLPSKNNSNFGGLVIQITADKDIWIRNYQKYSAYSVDTTEELLKIVEGIFTDDILWVIGFKDTEWIETTLIKNGEDIETEKGVTYNILSWSGKADKIFKVDDI